MNVHKILAAISIGGAAGVAALTAGTVPAIVVGVCAALGVVAQPDKVSRRLTRRPKGPPPTPGQAVDREDPR